MQSHLNLVFKWPVIQMPGSYHSYRVQFAIQTTIQNMGVFQTTIAYRNIRYRLSRCLSLDGYIFNLGLSQFFMTLLSSNKFINFKDKKLSVCQQFKVQIAFLG